MAPFFVFSFEPLKLKPALPSVFLFIYLIYSSVDLSRYVGYRVECILVIRKNLSKRVQVRGEFLTIVWWVDIEIWLSANR